MKRRKEGTKSWKSTLKKSNKIELLKKRLLRKKDKNFKSQLRINSSLTNKRETKQTKEEVK